MSPTSFVSCLPRTTYLQNAISQRSVADDQFHECLSLTCHHHHHHHQNTCCCHVARPIYI
uniref:Uncharacterized protein n=1 Tax=Rhizophora mucronata TaxID=61149 RepID=A0A2P2L052_RHIMU